MAFESFRTPVFYRYKYCENFEVYSTHMRSFEDTKYGIECIYLIFNALTDCFTKQLHTKKNVPNVQVSRLAMIDISR